MIPLRGAAFTLCFLLSSAPVANAASFIGLGDLPGGEVSSVANGVSADGRWVVGHSDSELSDFGEAFRWSAATGMIPLGFLSGDDDSSAHGISADGSVVTGDSARPRAASATFRWTSASGMQPLTPGGAATAFPVACRTTEYSSLAILLPPTRRAATLKRSVGPPRADSNSLETCPARFSIHGVSAFRPMAVLSSALAFRESIMKPTVGNAATGMVGLGELPGGEVRSIANAVSADGNVVVGQSWSAGGSEAFRWTAATGMVALGELAGGIDGSIATATNADGSILVGTQARNLAAIRR